MKRFVTAAAVAMAGIMGSFAPAQAGVDKLDSLMPVRGLCIAAPTPAQVDGFVKFINEELAPRHANTLVLRVDYGYLYQSHPELHDSLALNKSEVKRIVAACRKNHIRIIPQINFLGHQSWADRLGKLLAVHPEFDETPEIKMPLKTDTPDSDGFYANGLYCKSYCPLHPKLHEVLFSLMDELCDVFEADAFHAGMDEVFYLGENTCPRCQGRDKAELFAGEVRTLDEHLAAKNRRLWIWGDRLIEGKLSGFGRWEASYNNSYRAIDMIPRDVTICDWHYDNPLMTPYLFAMKGLNVVACPWNKPAVARAQADDMARFRGEATPEMRDHFQGMLTTVWSDAGSFMDEYYGRKKNTRNEGSQAECFKATFAEIDAKAK